MSTETRFPSRRAIALAATALAASPLAGCAVRRGWPDGAAPFWVVQPAADAATLGASLRGVAVPSERVAWASGSRGTVVRTTDGGATWARRPVAGADSLDFRGVWAADSLVAVAMSAGDGAEGRARLYRTVDGGRSWRLVLADTTRGVFFDAIRFWDARRGLVLSDPVGGRFVVYATDDGGASWRQQSPAGLAPALDGEAAFAAGNAALTVAAERHAWFVTGGPRGARVHHSADGGRTWAAAAAPVSAAGASAGLFAVAFRDAAHGVAVGGDYQAARAGAGHVARTDDGGTWTPGDAAGAARGYWSGLAALPERAGALVAVGGAGTAVSVDDGRSWTVVDTATYNAVAAARGGAWAVGPGGRVARMRAGPR